MVVADPGLEARRAASGVDLPHQSGVSECPDDVVDRLLRERAEATTSLRRNLVDVRVTLELI